MPTGNRRSITIFIPKDVRDAFYDAVHVLTQYYQPSSVSELITNVILGEFNSRGNHNVIKDLVQEDTRNRPANIAVSISGERYDAIMEMLEQLKRSYHRSSRGVVIVMRVIEAAKELEASTFSAIGNEFLGGEYTEDIPEQLPQDVLESIILGSLQRPDPFWSAYYRAHMDVMALFFEGYQLFIKYLEQEREKSLDLLAEYYQCIAAVLLNNGDIAGALHLLDKAVTASEQLVEKYPIQGTNYLASALYRRSYASLQLSSLHEDDNLYNKYTINAISDIERAKKLIPRCRPILGVAIALRVGETRILLNRPPQTVFPWIDYALRLHSLKNVYDESGVIINTSGILHVRAKAILSYHEASIEDTTHLPSINQALEDIDRAVECLPDEFDRWKLDFQVTKILLLIQDRQVDAAIDIVEQIKKYINSSGSTTIRNRFDKALRKIDDLHYKQHLRIKGALYNS